MVGNVFHLVNESTGLVVSGQDGKPVEGDALNDLCAALNSPMLAVLQLRRIAVRTFKARIGLEGKLYRVDVLDLGSEANEILANAKAAEVAEQYVRALVAGIGAQKVYIEFWLSRGIHDAVTALGGTEITPLAVS